MTDDDAFLRAIQAAPHDNLPRLVYADWLDERCDVRGQFLRVHLALRMLTPDHVQRPAGEAELSRLRRGLDPAWLAVAEPERAHYYTVSEDGPRCQCMQPAYDGTSWPELQLHVEPQDTECDGWKRLCELVEEAARMGHTRFEPRRHMTAEQWDQIVTLPPTIAKLKSVRLLNLYGSHLVRIPPEIGEMSALVEFTPYTSYRLHWYPYEIARCPNLRQSTVSTRAIYGNYKYRPPFPRLRTAAPVAESVPGLATAGFAAVPVRNCSVCNQPFDDHQLHRVWISLRVATDVLPLLVNACSQVCVRNLPAPAANHVQRVHRGGIGVQQPPCY